MITFTKVVIKAMVKHHQLGVLFPINFNDLEVNVPSMWVRVHPAMYKYHFGKGVTQELRTLCNI